ncbi:MAG: DUF234 domain-containing protein [Gemmatimonadaceae bacterium]
MCRRLMATYATRPVSEPRLARRCEWWDAGLREQIDVAALADDGELLIAECKWGEVTGGDLAILERRAQLLAAELGGVRRVRLAVFSGHGHFDAVVTSARQSGRVLGFTTADLLTHGSLV